MLKPSAQEYFLISVCLLHIRRHSYSWLKQKVKINVEYIFMYTVQNLYRIDYHVFHKKIYIYTWYTHIYIVLPHWKWGNTTKQYIIRKQLVQNYVRNFMEYAISYITLIAIMISQQFRPLPNIGHNSDDLKVLFIFDMIMFSLTRVGHAVINGNFQWENQQSSSKPEINLCMKLKTGNGTHRTPAKFKSIKDTP